MSAKTKLTYNDSGTHAWVKHNESGGVWACPIDYLDVAKLRGWEPTDAPDTSLDGLFDSSEQTGFDPSKRTVDEVNAHLAKHADSAPGEVARVLELERNGKDRATVVDPRLTDTGDQPESGLSD